MSYDIMILKADVDAASPGRLEAARVIADDTAAPRRALLHDEHRAEAPEERLEQFRDDVHAEPADGDVDWVQVFAELAGVDHGLGGLGDLAPDERAGAYDRLPTDLRRRWDDAFRRVAHRWIDFASDVIAADRHRMVDYHVAQIGTVDGGRLLVCAVDEDGYGLNDVPYWFEAVLFSLAEIADAAGYREPSRYDVT